MPNAPKKPTKRILLHLVCEECKNQNYLTERNRENTTEKLHLRKYCRHCKKHTMHKEEAKMK